MPTTNTVDEEVSVTPKAGVVRSSGVSARTVHEETIAPDGKVKAQRSSVEDEDHKLARSGGRTYKESTEKLLAKMEAEGALAPHEEGDADEDEPADDEGDAGDTAEPDDGDDTGTTGDADADADSDAEGDEDEEDEAPAALTARLEARNRELISELETARKTPKSQRSDRETALVAAEASYYDEGSVPALRRFLSVITGTAADSKEVDAELSGLYSDLTARELGVALDDNQRTLRDNARTRLLLARDKREKVEADKKPAADNSVDAVNYGDAAKHVDSVLGTKGKSGTSLADEYPMLMTLARDFDGYDANEVIARAIRQEILTGTLDPKTTSDVDMVRHVAPKIEQHYDALAKKIEAARVKQTKNTTTPSGKKPKAASETSTEQRRSTGAPTITNAAASRAPARNPKVETRKTGTTTAKTRKDFPSEAAWKDHLLDRHFKS